MKFLKLAALGLILAGPVQAQDFEKGMAAYQSRDYATALKEWRPLAERGDAFVQNNIGWMYYKGEGLRRDYTQAVKWFHIAAKQGDAVGQLNIAFMYAEGKGLRQDYAEAVKWFRMAAKQGHPKAHYNLGLSYYEGQGAPQDKQTAHMWFNLAAANGLGEAFKARDKLAKQMTPADVSEAQRRARVCKASKYKDCD